MGRQAPSGPAFLRLGIGAVKGRYIDSAIRAELKRAWAERTFADRKYLRKETGLTSDQLEKRLSANARDLLQETFGGPGRRQL